MSTVKEDPEALAKALARCANQPELAKQLAAAGRRTFDRHFTLDRFGSRFAELLESLGRVRAERATERDP